MVIIFMDISLRAGISKLKAGKLWDRYFYPDHAIW